MPLAWKCSVKVYVFSDVNCKAHVRSKLEHGHLRWEAAAATHLEKLNRIQNKAIRETGAKLQTLESRREAGSYGLLCKMLDDKCVEPLQRHCPKLKFIPNSKFRSSRKREHEKGQTEKRREAL